MKPLTVVFSNSSGDAPDYTDQTVILRARDHDGTLMFEITGEVSTTTTTGDTVTFMTTAANTTTNLDAVVSPVRAAAVDRTSLPCAIVHDDMGTKLTEGILNVGRAA